MGGRIVIIALLCLAIVAAPSAVADEPSGSCVWTSQNGTHVSAGYDIKECTGQGGQYQPERS